MTSHEIVCGVCGKAGGVMVIRDSYECFGSPIHWRWRTIRRDHEIRLYHSGECQTFANKFNIALSNAWPSFREYWENTGGEK